MVKTRLLLGILVIAMMLSIASCSHGKEPSPEDLTQSAPGTFTSFAAFEQSEKQAGDTALSHYFVPAMLSDDYKLARITKREDVYVMVEYTVEPGAVSAEKLGEYELERLSTLICRYSLYDDADQALEAGFIDKGYGAVEYQGNVYYRWDEYVNNDPEGLLLGYEIAFVTDGCLIYMHLPAIDTFENMMRYTKLQKIEIK
jgi:hypothetical protein